MVIALTRHVVLGFQFGALGGEALLEKAGIDPTARPEQLNVAQFAALANALSP